MSSSEEATSEPIPIDQWLNREARTPLYYQLQRLLQQQIESGQYQPGDALPSESDLVQRYQVSRITVRQALQALVREGYVHRQRGRGSFVAYPRLQHRAQRFGGYMDELRRRGLQVESRIYDLATTEPTAAHRQLLDFGDTQVALTYRRLIVCDGEPLMLSSVLFVMDQGMHITEDDLTRESIFPLVRRRYGLDLGPTDLAFGAVLAAAEDASLLTVSAGAPLLLVESGTRTPIGLKRLIARALFRGDRYKHVITTATE